jgi:hypothetical protein
MEWPVLVKLSICRTSVTIAALWIGLFISGCQGSGSGVQKPDGQDRVNKLFNLYRAYVDKTGKGPPNEAALREFGQKMSPTDRADRLIGDDLETIFTSPRDDKKFVVRYNVRIDPSQNKAVIWEDTGVNGNRLVALSIGYVVEYDEATLKDYKK